MPGTITTIVTCFILLISLDACLCRPRIKKSDSASDATGDMTSSNCTDEDTKVTYVSDVDTKAPLTGKLQRVNGTENKWGYIEHTGSPIMSFMVNKKKLPAVNNTWRVSCPFQYETFFVLMSLHLGEGDYLQIKKTKLNGTGSEVLDGKFKTFNFSKKSVLVSLVANSSVAFRQQSSFLMAYLCIPNAETAVASSFLNNNGALKYLPCRPRAFTELANLLVDPDTYESSITSWSNSKDFFNLLTFRSGKEKPKKDLPCNNIAWEQEEEDEDDTNVAESSDSEKSTNSEEIVNSEDTETSDTGEKSEVVAGGNGGST